MFAIAYIYIYKHIYTRVAEVTYKYNFDSLLPGDGSVMVAVVKIKCPVNLVILVATGTDTDSRQELSQVNYSIPICVISLHNVKYYNIVV